MRTNINIDDRLLREAQRLSKIKTKKETVDKALYEFVRFLKRQRLAGLKGKGGWDGDLESMRTD